MSFDPYAIAREHGDTDSLRSWERFADSIDSDILLTFDYLPFLQYERPMERDEYGPTHEVWVDSTRQVIGIFQGSLSRSFEVLPTSPAIELESYVPPGAYMRGGPITFPMELIQVVLENPWLLSLGTNVVSSVIYDAMKSAYKALRDWFEKHGVPESDSQFPSLSPFVVKSVAQGHAHSFFPNLSPGEATIIPSRPLDANYPLANMQFLVLIPYTQGTLIYFLDAHLNLAGLFRTRPGGFVPLRSAGWPKD